MAGGKVVGDALDLLSNPDGVSVEDARSIEAEYASLYGETFSDVSGFECVREGPKKRYGTL